MPLFPAPAQALFLVLIASLGGCTWSPAIKSWPVPPERIVSYGAPDLTPTAGSSYVKITRLKTHVEGLRDLVVESRLDRMNRDWASSDFTSLGVVGAVAGAMADQTGLLNTGAGMSVLGLTARERYQYGAQQAAYAGAQTALDCVLSQINSTNDAEVEWAGTQTGSKTTAQAAHALPDVIYKATKKVQQSLITRLGSISSEPIKGSEFDDVFRSQRSAYTKKNEASEQLQTQSQKDRVTIALKSDTQKMQALAKKDDGQKSRIDAEMMRITAERQLVPLHLQEMVGLNIVGMESKIAECTAGY